MARIKIVLLIVLILQNQFVAAQSGKEKNDTGATTKVPFDGYDLTWINGQNRQTDFPLVIRDKEGDDVATITAFTDCYYNYNFNKPIDNTHTISSSIGRSNEFTFNMASLGIECNYHHAIGRLWLQYGQMASIVSALDGSLNHGRNTSLSNLQYIREGAAGYHFDKLYGINIEMGFFLSYMGLESYVLNENWCYQRSLLCDLTPFYFSGARVQAYLSKKFKTEIWLINGWQTYNGWNSQIAVGGSNYYRPNTNLQLVANFYIAGHDVQNKPGLLRFHHDHSLAARYYDHKNKKGISQAAFSINNHYGFQTGDGVNAKDQYLLGTSIGNRIWFYHNKLAVTVRGDYVTNPGAYLAYSPSPVTNNAYTDAMNARRILSQVQGVATFDIMPTQFTTVRLEYGYRDSNLPYYAGPGGTTSPDGYITTPVPTTWRPDLVRSDSRLTIAVTFRI